MMDITGSRAGKYVTTLTGYKAFEPAKLPPDPPLTYDSQLLSNLSEADRKLGRLDGITQILPNPELFVAMYVKKEALLSSQIEGTQASLADVLNDSTHKKEYTPDGTKEVVNYVEAMSWGLKRLATLPLSLRLIREIHEILLRNVRGSSTSPGDFRNSQNWIGAAGSTLNTAAFIPPEPHVMALALSDLEKFLYEDDDLPPLVKIALIHAQFETIHPFLDGNGRIGRLLITFWLCQQKILSQPLLYLSYFFKLNRQEYYQKLMDIREQGKWEEWIKFFLQGIIFVSDEATASAKKIIQLQRHYLALIDAQYRNNGHFSSLLSKLFETPIISKKDVSRLLNVSTNTAGSIVDGFCQLGILSDDSPSKKRYKQYIFTEYFDILRTGTESL